ncbi:unnamed protein product [Dibothriocephalus latus]|uniref:Uncharacterized protein n=1 Tax=Dibothriocephalus latus TaxID=60516 RepID=A0A3P6RD18_DIBLA|nr:unnamed protein product [Dibothriocephalus latus]
MGPKKKGGRKPASVAAQSAQLKDLTLETPEIQEPKDLKEEVAGDAAPSTNSKCLLSFPEGDAITCS